MRGEGDIGDAGSAAIAPRGREEKRGHGGRTQNQLKTIKEHEGGRVMRDEEFHPLSEGAREKENPTHTPPRRFSVESCNLSSSKTGQNAIVDMPCSEADTALDDKKGSSLNIELRQTGRKEVDSNGS
jgi:hypothetical protein